MNTGDSETILLSALCAKAKPRRNQNISFFLSFFIIIYKYIIYYTYMYMHILFFNILYNLRRQKRRHLFLSFFYLIMSPSIKYIYIYDYYFFVFSILAIFASIQYFAAQWAWKSLPWRGYLGQPNQGKERERERERKRKREKERDRVRKQRWDFREMNPSWRIFKKKCSPSE